jgi:hypothetical protein
MFTSKIDQRITAGFAATGGDQSAHSAAWEGFYDERKLVFSGVRVLDIASFIAAPAATTVLSDYGAEVNKVGRSGMGDPHGVPT